MEKVAPAAPTTALSLATVLSLSTTLSFLSSQAKPRDLQFSSSPHRLMRVNLQIGSDLDDKGEGL